MHVYSESESIADMDNPARFIALTVSATTPYSVLINVNHLISVVPMMPANVNGGSRVDMTGDASLEVKESFTAIQKALGEMVIT